MQENAVAPIETPKLTTDERDVVELYKIITLTSKELNAQLGNGPLRTIANKVETFDEDLAIKLDRMKNSMYAFGGYGVAAVQVGLNMSMFVMDVSDNFTDAREFINPSFTDTSGDIISIEGCLSFHGWSERVNRFDSVTIKYQTRTGEHKTETFTGKAACCVQHEMDHLIGTLFIDRLSNLKKDIFRRWFRKTGPQYLIPRKVKNIRYQLVNP